jgi:multisubunit Na+/H+ antiporter MnhC subunit
VNEPLEFMLITMLPIMVCTFFAVLYVSHRARKKYERKEMEQKQYQRYQRMRWRHKRISLLFIGIGVILFLIGCYGFQTEPRFIIRENMFEVVEVNPELVVLLLLFALVGGGAFLAGGLALFVYSIINPPTDRQE